MAIRLTSMSTTAVSWSPERTDSHYSMFYTEMNLSHVITELSFGPFFPEMTQPLDNTYEITDNRAYK